MDKRYLTTLFLMLLFSVGCSDGGGDRIGAAGLPSSDAPLPTSSGPNGIHAGEVWIADTSGTERFNLQTGKTIEVSNGFAYPTKDGSVFAEVLDTDNIPEEYCQFASVRDAYTINIKGTRSNELVSSVKLRSRVAGPVRITTDAKRFGTFISRDDKDCGGNHDDYRFTVFSIFGQQIFRDPADGGYIQEFDTLPDGRFIVLKKMGDTAIFQVQVETAPGTHEFSILFGFVAPEGVLYYTGFRVNSAGTHGVLEAVYEKAHFFSGTDWRDARVLHFPLENDGGFGFTGETNLFSYPDKTRVNAPTFSPDGQFVLVTEGYLAGAFVSESHFPEIGVNETLLDVATRVPVKADSVSYIVPSDMKLQTMPPQQYSETMRPVLVRDDEGRTSAVGFNPIYGLSWTPVVQ